MNESKGPECQITPLELLEQPAGFTLGYRDSVGNFRGVAGVSQSGTGNVDWARYIVKACNAYPAMKVALEAALDCLDEVLEDTDGLDGEMIPNPLLAQIRIALEETP